MPTLQVSLDLLPADLDLASAGPEHLTLIGQLFSVLDGRGIKDVRGTILAKLLHRKRPQFIPLYDKQVGRVYAVGPDALVPWVRGRTWAEFQPLFARAVQTDLRREAAFWEEAAALTRQRGPPISRLRA